MEKKSKEEKLQEKIEKQELKRQRKEEKRNKELAEGKVSFKEKFSLTIRKKMLVDRARTFLLVLILILAYIALNLAMENFELPEIDVSKSKVYTLTDDSKSAIEKVNQDVKIYVYGFEEDSPLMDFLKQYNKVNPKITAEIITEESNYEKVKENDLQSGYTVLIFESGVSKKVVDASTQFSTTDYATSKDVDTTEQSITNAILSLMSENMPKIYFTEGHGEYTLSQDLSLLNTYLEQESFAVESVNLASLTEIPTDCDVLAIISPSTDFFDNERDIILNYISNGGKIYLSMDPLPTGTELPNVKTILAQYGVSVQNGQIIELNEDRAIPSSPNVFMPQVSTTHEITSDIAYNGQGMVVAASARLQFESDENLTTLNVEREDLIYSSEESIFITDLSTDINAALETAEQGSSIISSILTKNITKTNENGEEEEVQSKLIVSANGTYIANLIVEPLSESVPLAYIYNNKDFAINSLANLSEKIGLTIRKEIVSYYNFVPTTTEKIVVISVIFLVPVLIILIGFMVWGYRKKRK